MTAGDRAIAPGFTVRIDLTRLSEPPDQAPIAWTGVHRTIGGVLVIGDVRLDARSELTQTLALPPSAHDLDLIAAAWRRWGRDCPCHLIGAFAFVLWDQEAREIFAARDLLGIKPLFYDQDGQVLVLGSTVAAVIAQHPDPPPADPRAIAVYLTRPFDLTGFTSLRQRIRALTPGHVLTVTPPGAVERRYAALEDAPDVRFARAVDYEDAVLAGLDQAVMTRMAAAGPIGLHISGGLDSSAIAALTGRAEQKPAFAYCWQPLPLPGETEAPDQALVRLAGAAAGVLVQPIALTARDVLEFIAIDPMDQPATSTLLHEGAVQRAARRDGVAVLLSGWGGDQAATYCGNDLARTLPWSALPQHLLRRLIADPRDVAVPLWRQASAILRRPAGLAPRDTRARTYLKPAMTERWGNPVTPVKIRPASAREAQIMLLTRRNLSDRTEGWAWSGASHGIEYRYPMLDIRLVRLMLGLPPELYQPGPHGRAFIRRVLARILPPPIVNQTDKSDPTRMESLGAAIAAALSRLAPKLEGADPDRARYIDLPRLRHDIDRMIATRRGSKGLILRTLAFLKLPA